MVQNVGNQAQNPYGSINKLGINNEGRVVYQITDPTGKEAGKMSIAQADCDVFEKSYRDIMESVPKLQKYAETHSSPEDMKKLKTRSRWIIGVCTAIGGIVPMIKTKGATWKQVLFTIGGTIAGLGAGAGISYAVMTPPGAAKMRTATRALSKLEIRPEI